MWNNLCFPTCFTFPATCPTPFMFPHGCWLRIWETCRLWPKYHNRTHKMMINQVTVFHPKYNQRWHKDTSGVDTVPTSVLNIKMEQTRLLQLTSGLVAVLIVIWTCSVCFQLIHQTTTKVLWSYICYFSKIRISELILNVIRWSGTVGKKIGDNIILPK